MVNSVSTAERLRQHLGSVQRVNKNTIGNLDKSHCMGWLRLWKIPHKPQYNLGNDFYRERSKRQSMNH